MTRFNGRAFSRLTDFTFAARRLRATPLFTIFAVLSLGLGVSVTTAVYSIVDAIFLKQSGIHDPDRVAFVVTPYDNRLLKGSVSEPDVMYLRGGLTSFSALSAVAPFSAAVTSSSTTEVFRGEGIDGAYFAMLGVRTTVGRAIDGADDDAAARVVVLSQVFWRARFGADPRIIGNTIRISGHSFEIIGVAAGPFEGATGLVPGTQFWIPLSSETSLAPRTTSGTGRRRLLVFGRLAPAATIPSASLEVAAIGDRLDLEFPPRTTGNRPAASDRRWKARSATELSQQDEILHRFGFTIVALVALVLAVACTNLANLVLARGTTRQQEITVRYALGASRWRLVQEQCAESVLLAGGGAIAAWWMFQLLRVLLKFDFNFTLPMGERWTLAIQPELNGTGVAMAALSLLISLVVFGLEPAFQVTRARDIRGALAASAGGPPRVRRQRRLLRWQVAVAAGFFIIATMFMKETIAQARHDSGVAMERLGVLVLNLRGSEWPEARVRRTVERLLQEISADPSVQSVSAATGMPFGIPGGLQLALSSPGMSIGNHDQSHAAVGIAATPSIFKTHGIVMIRGRAFDERDQSGAAPVVVISELTARRIWGASDAIGRQLVVQDSSAWRATATVVGVARDTDVRRLLGDPHPLVYLPLSQRYGPPVAIAARSYGDATLAVRALRESLHRTEPDLVVDAIGAGRTILSGPFVLLRAAGVAALSLGVVTLMLAMAGLFGIQSHIVSYRTREIGLRMSVGATARQIHWLVLKDGCSSVVSGLAMGLFIGLAGRAIVRAYLDVEVQIVDPWMFLTVPVPLVLSAFCACYFPAQRAARVDPNVALRHL